VTSFCITSAIATSTNRRFFVTGHCHFHRCPDHDGGAYSAKSLARIEEDRTHLQLQINLLAEQKTTKIIMLLEELRRDLPHIPGRHEQHAETLQAASDPDAVLEAIEQRKEQRE
jgi:hypothetical protein